MKQRRSNICGHVHVISALETVSLSRLPVRAIWCRHGTCELNSGLAAVKAPIWRSMYRVPGLQKSSHLSCPFLAIESHCWLMKFSVKYRGYFLSIAVGGANWLMMNRSMEGYCQVMCTVACYLKGHWCLVCELKRWPLSGVLLYGVTRIMTMYCAALLVVQWGRGSQVAKG